MNQSLKNEINTLISQFDELASSVFGSKQHVGMIRHGDWDFVGAETGHRSSAVPWLTCSKISAAHCNMAT
jgi:hypothetical protein